MSELIKISEHDEFNGWDLCTPETPLHVVQTELQHAWRDFHRKHACPAKASDRFLQAIKDFCVKSGLPVRYFIKWSLLILGRFPEPWEFTQHWLQDEIVNIWTNIKDGYIVKSAGTKNGEAEKILKAQNRRWYARRGKPASSNS